MKFNFLGREIDISLEGERAILAVCVGIAFVFWFFTKMSNEYTTERIVEVEYRLPQGKTFATLPTEQLRATLKGTGWDLLTDYMLSDQKVVKVDLTKEYSPSIDQTTLLSRISDLSVNKRKLEITKTLPSTLFINFKNETRKKIPVRLESSIGFSEDFFPGGELSVKPDSITISGAKSLIDTIEYWPTQKIQLEEQRDTVFAELALEDRLSGLVRLSDTKVELVIPIEKWTEKKVYPKVEIMNAEEPLRLIPSSVEVTFSLPLSKFNLLSKEDFRLIVDVEGLSLESDRNTVPVLINKRPDNIRGVNIYPKSVRFYLPDTTQVELDTLVNTSSE